MNRTQQIIELARRLLAAKQDAEKAGAAVWIASEAPIEYYNEHTVKAGGRTNYALPIEFLEEYESVKEATKKEVDRLKGIEEIVKATVKSIQQELGKAMPESSSLLVTIDRKKYLLERYSSKIEGPLGYVKEAA